MDAGKDWRRKEKGMTEDEMVREHHWLKNLRKLPETVEDRGPSMFRSGVLQDQKESDTIQWLNNNNISYYQAS